MSVIGVVVGVVLSLAVLGAVIAVLVYYCLWYVNTKSSKLKQLKQCLLNSFSTRRNKTQSETPTVRERSSKQMLSSKENKKHGHMYTDEEMGLDETKELDELGIDLELAQQDRERLNGDLDGTDNGFDGSGENHGNDIVVNIEESPDEQADDVNAPLLETEKRESLKDKKSKRRREEDRSTRDKKRKKSSDRKKEEGARERKRKSKKEKEQSSRKEQRETTPTYDNNNEIEDKKELVSEWIRGVNQGDETTAAKGGNLDRSTKRRSKGKENPD